MSSPYRGYDEGEPSLPPSDWPCDTCVHCEKPDRLLSERCMHPSYGTKGVPLDQVKSWYSRCGVYEKGVEG